jgi:hypothetical protein
MVAIANLYTILDVSIQQFAVGLAILPLLVALAWYVSHPVHRRRLSAPSPPTRRSRTLPRQCFSSESANSSGLS